MFGLALALLVGAQRQVSASGPSEPETHTLLDVPYVSQPPELCGGAAVAMVLRYWGEPDVFPQDFASLVSRSEGGIPTGALASAVLARGWQSFVLPADGDAAHLQVRTHLGRGRPLVALIEVAPRTYHYIVVVGGTDQDVVVHDPARAPFRVLTWAEFDRAWAAAGRWTMLVLPPDGFRPGPATTVSPGSRVVSSPAARTTCDAMVMRSVDLATGGDAETAERGLVTAARLCPKDGAPLRELAGLRFSQKRWTEAQDLGMAALQLEPEDSYTWQMVGSSRSLMGDPLGALAAWNRAGEPRIDAFNVSGSGRTRQPVFAHASGLQPRQVLTPEGYQRALRRLRDVPAVATARMRYDTLDGGLATVDVFVDERRTLPRGWPAVTTLGLRALLLDEVSVDVPGGMGAGERERVAWRWSAGRPRVALGLAFPSPHGLPGILSLDGSWERQTYPGEPLTGSTSTREERRHVGVRLADWPKSWFRWQIGTALDRWNAPGAPGGTTLQARSALAAESQLDARLAGDRLALGASGGWWVPLAGGNGFGTTDVLAVWRSTIDTARPVWSVAAAFGAAGAAAPLGLWPGAGTGQGRSGLLRAHPLLTDGVLDGPAFGRTLAHGSTQYAWPLHSTLAGRLSVAGFADAARAWNRQSGLGVSPLYIDAGVGLRVHLPGGDDALRIDLAHGLRGGGTTLSASWSEAWPR